MNPKQQAIVSRALSRCITHAGSQVKLAETIGCAQSAVSKWLQGEARIAPERARLFERAFPGVVTKAELRPDLWG